MVFKGFLATASWTPNKVASATAMLRTQVLIFMSFSFAASGLLLSMPWRMLRLVERLPRRIGYVELFTSSSSPLRTGTTDRSELLPGLYAFHVNRFGCRIVSAYYAHFLSGKRSGLVLVIELIRRTRGAIQERVFAAKVYAFLGAFLCVLGLDPLHHFRVRSHYGRVLAIHDFTGKRSGLRRHGDGAHQEANDSTEYSHNVPFPYSYRPSIRLDARPAITVRQQPIRNQSNATSVNSSGPANGKTWY